MEIGDLETVRREEEKREAWQWENALRRHNFVGLAHELLKNVVRAKTQGSIYQEWIAEAREEVGKRIAERKPKEED